MPKYAVRVEGQNLCLIVDGEEGFYGFYTTRIVKAPNDDEARAKALEVVKRDPDLVKLAEPTEGWEPCLAVADIWRVHWWLRSGGNGFAFYGM